MTSDRGNATVLTAIGGAALLALMIIALQLGGAVITRHRAESAADLAALAGAAQLLSGAAPACDRAGVIAVANGALLVECELVAGDLRVVVSLHTDWGSIGGTVQGRARAGPVSAPLPGELRPAAAVGRK